MSADLINQIFQVCLIPMFGVLTTFFVKWINAKSAELQTKTDNDLLNKYIQMLTETINDCVVATNQTYVDALKDKNAFDEEAQKIAFEKTSQAVLNILSQEAKDYLTEAFGDLNKYIDEKIEATVKANKA